jgi:hypothetical protein
MTDREQLCKEFTELTGGQWHDPDAERNFYYPYMCSCRKEYWDFDHLISHCISENPTYENPTNILKVIYDNFGDAELQSFLCWTGYYNQQDDYDLDWIKDNLFEPDTLLKKAIEFLIEMEKWK